MNKKMLSLKPVAAFAVALLLSHAAQATPEQLDWDGLTWTPPGNSNLSETYNTGGGDITVTFTGNTAGLDQAGADISPDINQLNTGGLSPAQNGLYVATDYVDNSNSTVTITIDFTGYPGGVGNVSFDVFDMDANGTSFIDEMTVTADTLTGTIDPTSIVTNSANTQVNSNTVRGTASSVSTSSNGNITWVFGDAGTPVSGITRFNITWRNVIGGADPGFQWINIHDIDFDDPMADVSVTKGASLTDAEAGDTVVFTLDVANAGPDDAPGIEITDQLPNGFTYLTDNSGGAYNPVSGIWDVGTLAPAGTAQITIDARMEATGPWDNVAEATQILATDTDSTANNNVPAEDDQDNAAVNLLVPVIGAAKAVTTGPVNNGDGTYTLTYTIAVENSGDTVINNLQVVDDLAATFSGATGFTVDGVTSSDFTVNPGYDGDADSALLAGTDTLATATTGTIALTATVTPGAAAGPFDNTATAGGTSPSGNPLTDDSTDGADPDPDMDGNPGNNAVPTPIVFAENPIIGTAKEVLATPTNNGDGTYTLTYRIAVENLGDVPLSGVQIVDDLALTFTGTTSVTVDSVTSADFAANPGYNGTTDTNVLAGTDSLAVAASGTVDVVVTIDAGGNLGPFDNTATASGTSPASTSVNDASTTGSDPDPDMDGNPGNNSVPTSISFTENPQIGVAKAITTGPANNGDGTHTLTYTMTLENFGDVPLNNLQIVDNLGTTFSGATGFTVDSVTSTDFTANAGFNGTTDTNILSGTDGGFIVGATGTVDVTVTVTPGGNLGPYDNSVFAQGFSPAGSLSLDNSVAGLDPDPDGNGDPVDNTGPTPVTFGENPEIGTAKAITTGPANNGDGTYTLTYTITLENSGDVPLSGVQIVDDLAATFTGTTSVTVDNVTSTDFAANPGYNGTTDTNVLTGGDSLAVAATGSVDIQVTVDAGGNLGPFDNTATASGTSPASTTVNDASTDGVDPDPDMDGNPGNNSVPTMVSFAESPQIGLAKALTTGPANNGDGTHTLTYTFTLENFGDVPLNNLQIVDNLGTAFSGATGFTVDSVTSTDFTPNPGYDGSGDTNILAGTDGGFAVGATGTVDVTVTVTPGGNLGPYDNSAFAQGVSPGGSLTLDNSADGLDPDPDGNNDPVDNVGPTPVTFGESPEIGTAKAVTAGPVNNGDGTFSLTYTITVENTGDVSLTNVQVVDSLATTFATASGYTIDALSSADFAVNTGYDGNADSNLLAGSDSLAPAASGTITLAVTVDAGGNAGPYDNAATASGTSPAATVVSDVSTDGADPDPDMDGNPGNNSVPTPVTLMENPEVGIAKTVSSAPVNNGDGTFTFTYTMTVENSGDVDLSGVQVTTDLATAFAAATGFTVDAVTSTDFAVNPSYDGSGDINLLAGSDSLVVAGTGTIDLTITVTPGGTLGPYDCIAIVSGISPGATAVNDTSTDGVDPDPDADGDPGNNSVPTTVSFAESPQIGVAKALSAGPTNNGDGSYTLTYTMTVENFGDGPLNEVQVVENLASTFSAATSFTVDSVTSADFATNPAFDGDTDRNLLDAGNTLALGASGALDLSVTVTPGGTLGPYDNSVFAQGSSPGGVLTLDNSVDGLDPDPDGNNDPVDNVGPTPVTFAEAPVLGLAKSVSAGPVNNGDGTFTLTYTMTVANSGDVALDSLQVTDDLAATYAMASGFVVDALTSGDFAVNAGYDGSGDINLLAGSDSLLPAASGTLELIVTVTPGAMLGPYDNSATATATSPGGMGVSDVSQAGANPDPDGNGDPGDNSDPTPVSFAEMPQIGVAKSVDVPVNNGDGSFTLTYTITVENSGDVPLSVTQVTDDLATAFAGAAGYTVDSVTSGDFAVNPAYDGNTDTNLLAGTDLIAVGATGTIALTVTVTPGGNAGPYDNTAVASAETPAGTPVSDLSTTGADPDPGNDGPGDDMTPTPVTFGLEAAIEGNAWLDQDIDDLFDSDEPPLEGWIIEVLDDMGNVIGSAPVAADGSYSIGPLPPGSGYTVQLRHPSSNTVFGVLENVTLPPGLTVIDQNLPIDPSGVVYDTDTRLPIAGVTVTMVDGNGTPLPDACLLPDQQNQVTAADGLYRFDVLLGNDPACPSGGTYNIVFTVPAGYTDGVSTTIPPTPGPFVPTGLPDPFQVQPQATPPTGAASTLYYLGFVLSFGDPNVINNHIPLDPLAAPTDLMVSKRADRRLTVVGDMVRYTVTVENPGAAVTDLTLSDLIPAGFTYVAGSARPAAGLTVSGQRPVVFSGIDIPAGGSTELSYILRVGAGVVQGDYINTVTPLAGGMAAGNSASATVTVTADPDFEQTSVVGMVFSDANGNGWQDEGEAGIPGVRLATVEGLIIETDAFGRYHLAGIDGGRHDRGRNFIIKVDQASLPDGVEFTTENPRVQRITEGLLNQFDFGVRMPAGSAGCCETIDVKIGEIFFTDGSAEVRPEFLPLIGQLADRLRQSGGGKLYLEGHAEPSEAVAYTADALTITQYFTPRSTEIRPEYKRELDALIAKWRGADNVSLSAIGHTCNTPIAMKNRKEFKDNYELSRARAQAVASYVRVGLGIAPEQVSIQGKGPDEPIASNATPEGGAKNRRVELTVSGQRSQRQAGSAADLARDRANAVYQLLQQQLGEELLRNISITTGEVTTNDTQESEMTSDIRPGWLSRGAGALLGMFVGTAHAAMPQACTVDSCRTDEGYVIQIMPSSTAPSPNDTRAALADNKRVDFSGQFSVPVGGGMLWATEDPSGAQPRLALHAPEVAPVANGRLAAPVNFFVYSNYAMFIDRAEIEIYHGDNIDLIEPLAVVPFKPGVFSRVEWSGAGAGPQLAAGDELYYRVRAYDSAGRYDETHLEQLRLVSTDQYERSDEADPDLLMPEDMATSSATTGSRGPLNGNVLVLQPPAETTPAERRSYTVTPRFDSRKTVLKANDRAELDRIISEWRGAGELRLHVVGHTDNVRIAPQNRKEFANNQVLSEARASAVAAYVASRLGIKPGQVSAEGRADLEPVAANDNAAGRAKNRRVELTVTGVRRGDSVQTAAGTKLVEPFSNTVVNIGSTLEEAANLMNARLGEGGFSASGRRYADANVAQLSAHALEAVYGRSDLRVQRIPVNGSRVRINGQDINGNMALRINGDPVPLDTAGKYAVEYLVPVGKHDFDVELLDSAGVVSDRRRLPVEVSGKHIFLVALADLTLSDNSVSGSIEPLAADDRYDDDFLVEGRLAFYLKGKVKGKYLITAQLDTTEEEIGDMFSNLFDKDPRSVFRRLDPDRYYPVYGDDSTTISDTDTQGRFYFRADWDRSSATWGNFHTGFTGNEFAQYNRSLYGASYRHESLAITAKGEAKREVQGFVSEAQTAFGHSEFIGTGGSLYYLRHQDILPGSEKAWIEVRDRDNERVREVITLQRGLDYEVDEIQGRIILSRPLMQVSRLHAPG
ncbi:MAG: DUF11 domain-containing protein, partial [Gammaproteobacteria bacterium]|nr:DUF11 domain-containing protein [Gammaproteobacteria bacterium]